MKTQSPTGKHDVHFNSSGKRVFTTMLLATSTMLAMAIMPAKWIIDANEIGKALGVNELPKLTVNFNLEALATTTIHSLEAESYPPAPEPLVLPSQRCDQVLTQSNESYKTYLTQLTVEPGESKDIKLEMCKGAQVTFRWRTSGGPVDYETRGEPYSDEMGDHSYSVGSQSFSQAGEFTALFDGTHGWRWRNPGPQPVVISIMTTGNYRHVM
jgi:hypothetical protein